MNIPGRDWWEGEDGALYAFLYPLIVNAVQEAAGLALAELPPTIARESIINGVVSEWAKQYSYSAVKGINDTTRKFLQKTVSDWTASGLPLSDLYDALEPAFGETRANVIGTTEVTRAFTEGNFEAYRASGVVDEYDVRTAEDADVDEVCMQEAAGGPYPLTDQSHKPPFHVNCRCWIQPVVRLP